MTKSQTIVVVDYGMGNLRSVAHAVQQAAPESTVLISNEAQHIHAADRLVLPGQGAMPDCMAALKASGVQEAVSSALETRPVLGICVGMQMLFEHSDEGDVPCLGLWSGRVAKFAPPDSTARNSAGACKVPHMGWNIVRPTSAHPLWRNIPKDSYFYFVHSYYATRSEVTCAITDYAEVSFASAVLRDNVFATQFHPEKSAQVGLQLLRNFCSWSP